jgi:predicted acyl esterase
MRLGSHGAARRRLRARSGPAVEEPYVPGTAVALTLDLGGIGHTFLTGHRLRLSVCSSAYPETFPNPGTGEPVTTNTAQPRVARQRVFHDFAHPSWLELPVVSLPPTEA